MNKLSRAHERFREVMLDIMCICDRAFVDDATHEDCLRVLERIAGICVGTIDVTGEPWNADERFSGIKY